MRKTVSIDIQQEPKMKRKQTNLEKQWNREGCKKDKKMTSEFKDDWRFLPFVNHFLLNLTAAVTMT